MNESTAILVSIAAIVALIPIFVIGRKRGKKNLVALRLAIAEALITLRKTIPEIPDQDYSISEINRWFRNWEVMIEFDKTTIVLLRFRGNSDRNFKLIQSEVLERKG